MNNFKTSINIRNLSPLSLLVLTACGGGDSTISSLLTSASGKVIKGPLNNALVGLDYNGDGIVDSATVRTDANGGYSISTTETTYTVIAVTDASTIDTSSGAVMSGVTLKAPAGATVVTPTSTLMEEGGITVEQVASVLGLPDGVDPLTFNPYGDDVSASDALAVEQASHQIMSVVNAFAAAAEGSGASEADAFDAALNSIVEVVKTKVANLDDDDASASDKTLDLSNTADLALIKAQAITQVASIEGVTSETTTAFDALADDTATAVENVNTEIAKASDLTSDETKSIFSTTQVLADQVKAAAVAEVETSGTGSIDFTDSASVVTSAANVMPSSIGLTTSSISEGSETLVIGVLSTVDSDQPDGVAFKYEIAEIVGTDYASFSINQSTGELSLKAQPDYETKSTYSVTILSTDSGGKTLSETFTVTITDVNEAPTVANAIPDQTIAEDSALSFQFNSDVFADVDTGESLNYTATLSDGSALPTWLTFDAATRTFSGTPLNENVGAIDVKVTATDSGSVSITDTFTLTVTNTNDAPTVANAIPDQAATEDSAFSYQFNSNVFADVDAGDSLTYTATLSDGSALPSWLTFDADTRTFSGTPLNANVGAIDVKVTATDSGNDEISDTFNLTVANTNDAPTGSLSISGTATQGQVIKAVSTLADADGIGDLAYQWSEDGVAISGATSSTFTPGQDQVGKQITVSVSYTDDGGNTEIVASSYVADVVDLVVTVNTGARYKGDGATGNVFYIDGEVSPSLEFIHGNTYIFDQSNSSNSNHPLRFQLADGTAFTDGVTSSGRAGTAGATVTFVVPDDATAGLEYYCTIHGIGMGGALTTSAPMIVSNVNDDPSGDVTITGTLMQGSTLTAVTDSLVDTDGLGDLSYQWMRDGSDIVGANSASYTLTADDFRSAVSVSVSYIDAFGTAESKTSVAKVNWDLTLIGDDSDNILTAGSGDDTLNGGSGDDTLNGGSGNDTLIGGDGDDIILTGIGTDEAIGGLGDDLITVDGSGAKTIDGGAGTNGMIINYSGINSLGSFTSTIDDNYTVLTDGLGNSVSYKNIETLTVGSYAYTNDTEAKSFYNSSEGAYYLYQGGNLVNPVAFNGAENTETEINSALLTVSTAAEGASDRTSIAALPSGGFVSVWHEGGGKDGDGQGVFGRIIDENYNRSGEEFLINTLTTSHQSKAFVASLSDGTFMVVWSGGDGSSQGQVFSSSAVKIGEQFEIGPWFNQEAYIIGTADNKFMVVRGQNNQDSGILSVYDATGNLLIDDVVLTTAGKNLEIRIAEVGDNRFVASWFDSNNSVGSEIYGRIIDGSGESISADLQFNSTTLYNQQAPEVVGLKDGNFAVVWQSDTDGTETYDIIARLFDREGDAITDEIIINEITLGEQTKPSIATSSSDEIVIAWQTNETGVNEVLYQTLDFDGRLKSGNKKLSIDDNGDFVGGEDVTLTTSEDGHIVAAWDDQTGNIYAKNINENTETEINSALLTVSTAAEGASDRTSIAALPSGGFVSVWHEGGGKDGDGQGVFGRIIDENYNRSGEEFLINTLTTSHQSKAFVASLSDGTFMVVWSGGDGSSQGQVFSSSAVKIGEQFEIGPWFNQEAYIIGTADNKFMVVRGQNNQDSGILSVYDATGNLLIDDVVLTTAGKNLEIRIAEVGDNRFVASWFDSNNSVGSEIYGRIIDGSGESISADLQFNSTTLYNQQAPEVVGLKDGNFAVVWQSDTDGTETYDIIARLFDREGDAITDEIIINEITLGEQTKPSIATSSSDEIVIAWQTNETGVNEVLYQTLDFDGRLKSGNKKLSIDDNGDFVGGEDVTLTTSEDGHIVAAWDDQTGNIYAKNINENTETEINSALLTVSTAAEGASDRTSIAALPSGGFVSVWHEGGGKDGDGQGVFGRIIDENYNRSGEEFLINTLTTSHQSKAFVASLSDGTFMVVWSGGDGSSQGQVFSSSAVKIGEQFEIGPWFNQEAYIIGTADNKFMVVRGQNNQDSGILSVYDATGNLLIDDVVLTTAGKNLEIRIAEVGDNRFVASWFDSNNSVGSEIYGRIIDGSGESISADLQFNSTTLYNQQAPEVVGLKDGNFAVVWQSDTDGTETYDIIARLFDREGDAITDEIIINEITLGEQTKPSIATSSSDEIVIAWQTNETGVNEVLYQTLDFDGRLKSGNKKLSIDDNGDFVGGEDVTLTTSEDGHIVAAWDDQTGNIYAKNIPAGTPYDLQIIGSGAADTVSLNVDRIGPLDPMTGNFVISLGEGDDIINLALLENNDIVNLGSGNDLIEVVVDAYSAPQSLSDINVNTLDGGDGVDTLSFASSGFTSHSSGAALGLDTGGANNFENVIGTYFADTIYGDDNSNYLYGYSGSADADDVIYGQGGNDFLLANNSTDGGNDRDWLTTPSNGENLSGQLNFLTKFDATGDVQLFGGAGDDVLIGAKGEDILDGGTGRDHLAGGDGIDTFVMRTGDGSTDLSQADVIYDFTDGVDVLGLDDGLQFSELNRTQGTGDNVNDTIISHGSEYLAILQGIDVDLIDEASFTPVDIA